jgi:hypothetical protein
MTRIKKVLDTSTHTSNHQMRSRQGRHNSPWQMMTVSLSATVSLACVMLLFGSQLQGASSFSGGGGHHLSLYSTSRSPSTTPTFGTGSSLVSQGIIHTTSGRRILLADADADGPRFCHGQQGRVALQASSNSDDAESREDDSDDNDNADTEATHHEQPTDSNATELEVDGDDEIVDVDVDQPQHWTTKLRKQLGLPKFSKSSLQKKGMDSLLAYGLVSNVSGCLSTGVAWYFFNQKYKLSPLAPGQWPKFMTFYTSFLVMLQVVRPARLALSLYLTRYYAKARDVLMSKDRMSGRRATAVLFVFNFLMAWGVLFAAVGTASLLTGVPVWTSTPWWKNLAGSLSLNTAAATS